MALSQSLNCYNVSVSQSAICLSLLLVRSALDRLYRQDRVSIIANICVRVLYVYRTFNVILVPITDRKIYVFASFFHQKPYRRVPPCHLKVCRSFYFFAKLKMSHYYGTLVRRDYSGRRWYEYLGGEAHSAPPHSPRP